MNQKEVLKSLWTELYPQHSTQELDKLINDLDTFKSKITSTGDSEWYKDVVVYSLYVDLFNQSFEGLIEKLDYLQELGVNCLWLLPILDSPMKDGGFDIRKYDRVRKDLLGLSEDSSDAEQEAAFSRFLKITEERNIKIIFDIAMNHCSEEHFWFQEAKKSKDNPYRDYFIWSDTTEKYKDARIIFRGMMESNWEKSKTLAGEEQYYLHRFYDFQPDLNYRNPAVLLAMTRTLLYWQQQGVDGFRADAIPFLWKEENTDCENLEHTHTILKFYRAALSYVKPETLILAEACQPPVEVVKYFADGDECQAAYHFPVMPMIYKAIALGNPAPIITILNSKITPAIPEGCQWFTFLRNHDEMTLEMITKEDRDILNQNYLKKPEWGFREDEGISARLSELMDLNPQKIGLAYSIMFTLPGTPIIYYGDEFGRKNDVAFFEEMKALSGYGDSRFYCRGRINWDEVSAELNDNQSFTHKVYDVVHNLLITRNKSKAFGRGTLEWNKLYDAKGEEVKELLSFYRTYEAEKVLVINNLTEESKTVIIAGNPTTDMLGQHLDYSAQGELIVKPYQYSWLGIKEVQS